MDKLGIEPISSRKKGFISLSPTLCFCTEQESFYGESFFRKNSKFCATSTLGAVTKPSSRRLPNCHCLAHGAETESNPCRRFSLCPCFTLRMARHARLFKKFADDLKTFLQALFSFGIYVHGKYRALKEKIFFCGFNAGAYFYFPFAANFSEKINFREGVSISIR